MTLVLSMARPRGKSHRLEPKITAAKGRNGREGDGCKSSSSSVRVWGQRLGQSKEAWIFEFWRIKVAKHFKVVTLCALCVMCMLILLCGCSADSTNYEPQSKSPVISSPTIGEEGTLRVGVDTGNSPLAGMVNNKIVGLDVDIAAALADSLGLKLSIVDVGSDPTTALSEGKVDIVLGIDKSSSSYSFWCSDAYLTTGIALFSLPSNLDVPTKDSGATFAAQVSSRSAWAVMNTYGESSLTSTNNLADAFSSLSSGSVEYVASDAIVGIYAAHSADIEVSVVAFLQQPSGYCIGVSDTNEELKTTISDAVATMTSNGVIDVIEKKWLGESVDFSNVTQVEGASTTSTTTTTTSTTAG